MIGDHSAANVRDIHSKGSTPPNGAEKTVLFRALERSNSLLHAYVAVYTCIQNNAGHLVRSVMTLTISSFSLPNGSLDL